MFCFQCQETAKGTGCTVVGVCGKDEKVAALQDLLVYVTKAVSYLIVELKIDSKDLDEQSIALHDALFMTITNANFDADAIVGKITELLEIRNELKTRGQYQAIDATDFTVAGEEDMIEKAQEVGIMACDNEDIRSLREMIIYGVKGIAAYAQHALNLGKIDYAVNGFIFEAMAATLDDQISVDDLVALTLKTGEFGVKAMALLDEANTAKYGSPEITEVQLGVRNNPAILISGHDLVDLEQLLEQTAGTGIDVYTHGEMLPGHYYPAFKKYDNFAGNYGGSWWQQLTDFDSFNGPILFTTNCIVPPKKEEIRQRIYTTGAAGFPGCTHIDADENGNKDFSAIIAHTKTLPSPTEIESGTIVGGFAHDQVFALADKVVDAVKSGAIKKFFVMAGCDGRMNIREYYTDFAKQLPNDTVILTAGCAKYRYNKLGLGDIGGIPRVLDAGQCNDSYSLVAIALKLQEIFGLDSVNDLPIAYNIAWYEQKAVIVLLALLYLGVKDIHLGPSLPAFLSPNVAKVLVENFGITPIKTVEEDIELFLNN